MKLHSHNSCHAAARLPCPAGIAEAAGPRPNVLFIAVDDLNHWVGCLGRKPHPTWTAWRDYVVAENHMVQTGEVDGMCPTLEGRMVRSERFKYCVFVRGQQRESLVDLQADPGETTDLATDPRHRKGSAPTPRMAGALWPGTP